MKKVAVMTDTASDMAQEIAGKFDIKLIPFHIIMDDKDCLDTEIDIEDLYARVDKKENIPTMTPFPVGECLQAFQEVGQSSEAILYISASSGFTAAYKVAIQAKETAREKLPKTAIEVIDSRTAHGAQLLCVLEAARAAAEGKSLSEIVGMANELIPKLNLLYILDTVYYLGRGGRMGKASAWTDSVLGMKSILKMDASTEGVMTPLTRASDKG